MKAKVEVMHAGTDAERNVVHIPLDGNFPAVKLTMHQAECVYRLWRQLTFGFVRPADDRCEHGLPAENPCSQCDEGKGTE